MQPTSHLHTPVMTPSQRLAAVARMDRAKYVASHAHPDSPIVILSASERANLAPEKPLKTLPRTMDTPYPPMPPLTITLMVGEVTISYSRDLTIEKIQDVVAKHFNVRRFDLVSNRRTRNITHPRQVAMYFATLITPHSSPMIGRNFGKRDHTTVLHAVKKISAMRIKDAECAFDLDVIERNLAQRFDFPKG